MRIFVIVILLVFSIGFCFAEKGLYVEQKVNTSGVMGQKAKESISKTWMTENYFKVENDEQTMIFDFGKDVVYNLMPGKKEYFEITMDQMRQMAQMGKAMMKNAEEKKMTFKKTGNTKKINNWNCYEVVSDGGFMKQTLWISEDLPYSKDMFYKFYSKMPEFEELAKSFYDAEDLKGFPVSSQTEMNMMGMIVTSSSELILIREEDISADTFNLPSDYKKVENPMGGMFQAKQFLHCLEYFLQKIFVLFLFES